jgi:hypothetical protein
MHTDCMIGKSLTSDKNGFGRIGPASNWRRNRNSAHARSNFQDWFDFKRLIGVI